MLRSVARKYLLCIIVAMFLLLTGGRSSGETIQLSGAVSSVYVIGDTLYSLVGSKIVAYSSPGSNPETIYDISKESNISKSDYQSLLLTGDGEHLYLLYPYKGILYEVNGTTLDMRISLDLSDIGQPAQGKKKYVIFSHPVICDDALYLLSLDPVTYGSMELYRFSLQDGSAKAIVLPGADLSEITNYKNGQLLLYENRKVIAFDPASEKEINTIYELPNYSDGSIAFDVQQDLLYYISGSRAMRSGKQATYLDHIPVGGASDVSYAAIWQGYYVVLTEGMLYLCDTIDAQSNFSSKQGLTIWVNGGILDRQAINQFNLEHPEIVLDIMYGDDDSTLEKITTENLARNSGVDVFIFSSDLINPNDVFSRGYAAPIQSNRLEENVHGMYPQVKELLFYNEDLLGYPIELSVFFFAVQPELLHYFNDGVLPETFEDYCDMMLQWYDLYEAGEIQFSFNENQLTKSQLRNTLEFIITQYVYTYEEDDTPLSFNTPVFRSVLEKLKMLTILFDDTEVDTNGRMLFSTSTAVSPFIRMLNPSHAGEHCILPPVFALGQTPVLSSRLVYAVVNPNSSHQTEALSFLEFYADHISLTQKYMLYPAYNELVENDTFIHQITAIDDDIAIYQRVIEQEREFISHVSDSFAMEYPYEYASHIENLAANEELLTQAQVERNRILANRYICSAESISEYRTIAEYVSFSKGARVRDVMSLIKADDILLQYFDGNSTLDQVLQEVDQKVLMVYYERQ